MLNVCRNISDTYVIIHALACFIGIASWVDMSGLWLQLPIFVTVLPEKWTLASYVILIQQAANIGPIIFAICACVFATKKVEQPTSCLIIVVGIIACLLLSFFWDKTSLIGGTEHSTAFFLLSFMLAFVDTTSSLAFLSFMAMLKPEYLPSYFVGEGLSSLLPALVAFGQGSGNVNCVNISNPVAKKLENGTWNNFTVYYDVPIYDPPVFSVQYFFLILAGFLTLSLLSFILLMGFPKFGMFEKAYSSHKRSYDLEKSAFDNPGLEAKEIGYTKTDVGLVQKSFADVINPDTKNDITKYVENNNNSIPVSTVTNNTQNDQCNKILDEEDEADDTKPVSTGLLLFLLAQTCWKGILFTTTISIQPYFALPYGLKVYHLSNTLGTVALPVGCLACLFFPLHSTIGVTVLTLCYSGLSAYFFYMASQSPFPPLIDHEAGPAVLVSLTAV